MDDMLTVINYLLVVGAMWTVVMVLLMWRRKNLEKRKDECNRLWREAIAEQIEQ